MNKKVKQVVEKCRAIVKEVRQDDYFSPTLRANFVIELEKFDSKKDVYLIVVRDRRVSKEPLYDKDRLRVNWIRGDSLFGFADIWEMANVVLVEMQKYERSLLNS